MTLWAVVPAAGGGSRLGAAVPKQHLDLVALAVDDRHGDALPIFGDRRVRRCSGGATRADSVAAGIAALATGDGDWVLVHDAARPCLPLAALEALIDRVLEDRVGGLLAQPQTDTLKRADAGGRVLETLPREGLWRAQTPQMFPAAQLARALAAARDAAVEVTDEAAAMERLGLPVQLVEGPGCNIKVTYRDDVDAAAQWLARRAAAEAG